VQLNLVAGSGKAVLGRERRQMKPLPARRFSTSTGLCRQFAIANYRMERWGASVTRELIGLGRL